jgi:hypothetical protein
MRSEVASQLGALVAGCPHILIAAQQVYQRRYHAAADIKRRKIYPSDRNKTLRYPILQRGVFEIRL